MSKRNIFALCCALPCVVAGLVILGWMMAGDPISQSQWVRIRVGMTRQEVLDIMGPPDDDYGVNDPRKTGAE